MSNSFNDLIWGLEQMLESVESALDDLDPDSPRYSELAARRNELLDQLDNLNKD